MIGGLATTDHLLPKKKYPELDFTNRALPLRDYLNAVPGKDAVRLFVQQLLRTYKGIVG